MSTDTFVLQRLRPYLVAAALAGAGCGVDATRDGGVTRDTVIPFRGEEVAVRIVESAADAASHATWRVDGTPVLDLGGLEGSVALFRVSGAYRLSDGRIAVADGGSSQLKVFGADGHVVQSIGGPGEGPGEFRQLTYFGLLPGDSLLVWDLGQARLTVFGDDGERARETRIGATPESPRSSVAGVFADGSLLARGFVDLGGRVPDGLERHEAALFHLAPDGTLVDSIGSFPGSETYFRSFDGGFSFYIPPFGRTSEVIVAGDRLYVADSERPEIRILTAAGTPERLVRWTQRSRRIGRADIDRARDRTLARTSSDRRPDVERMFADMTMPESMPAFARIRVDRDDNLWVQRYRTEWDEGMSEWLVFDDEGMLTASIELPPRLVPTDIGRDYVLGIERDALDLEFVRLYRLHRE